MLKPDEVLALYQQRVRLFAPIQAMRRQISDIYAGRHGVDLPEHDEIDPAAVPNLIGQAIDQLAGRANSTSPMWLFAPRNPDTKRDVTNAKQAAKVLGGLYALDRYPTVKGIQRYRHLFAYAASPVVIRWDASVRRPVREVRNPMEAYPSVETWRGTALPQDCVFAYRRSLGWLKNNGYEGQAAQVMSVRSWNEVDLNQELLMLEYISVEGRMLCLVGYNGPASPWLPIGMDNQTGAQGVVLCAYEPNVFGYDRPMVSIPTRIALDAAMGQFDTATPMYYRHAKILALELAAMEKGIWPDAYLVGRPGEQPRFLEGPFDGRTGKVNKVTGGVIQYESPQPSPLIDQRRDYMERNLRVTAGIPAEFGGESGSNIRTARRGDSVMSSVIDFPLGEVQNLYAEALADEDRCMIALLKAYEGDVQRTIYVGVGNQLRPVTYVANQTFDHDEHRVTYPMTGTDTNSLRLGLGQARGMGTMSIRTAMELDPTIADPELEHDRIQVEGMEQALMTWVQQQLANGSMPGAVGARIAQMVLSDRLELWDAIQKATDEYQAAQQANQDAANPAAGGAPGTPPGSPEADAAMAALTGSNAPPAPGPGQVGLAQLFRSLHTEQTAGGAVAGGQIAGAA